MTSMMFVEVGDASCWICRHGSAATAHAVRQQQKEEEEVERRDDVNDARTKNVMV